MEYRTLGKTGLSEEQMSFIKTIYEENIQAEVHHLW